MKNHDLTWDDVPSRLMEAGLLCVCRECGAAFRTVGEYLETRCRPDYATPRTADREEWMVCR